MWIGGKDQEARGLAIEDRVVSVKGVGSGVMGCRSTEARVESLAHGLSAMVKSNRGCDR
jgi:hypothetical protein